MPELEWIKAALNDAHIPDVARATGISDPTLRNIASGKNANPTITTLNRIAEYLKGSQ